VSLRFTHYALRITLQEASMRSLNALIWRNLTAHALRSILTALAITLGVAMVLAASIVGQAAGRSASELADERPRVDLEVFSRDGAPFDDSVLDTLRTSPDVERVSPSLRVEAESIDPEISKLTLLGVDPESYAALHEPELAGGAFLDQPDTVVLPMVITIDNHLHVGDEITLKAGDRVVALTVAGRLKMESEGVGVGQSPTAFVPLNTAQTLAGVSGQIDRVEVVLRPNTDANQVKADLAQQVGTDLVVVRAEVVGGAAFNTMLVQGGLAMVGLIILFAAGFVIMNAFAMSVAGRTREIGALRSLGMTRHQVLRTVLAEAGLLGLIGAVLGLLVGVGLAWGVMRVMGALGDAPFVVPWWGVVFSPLLGLAVTLVGALQPAWRASRISPLVAVSPETRITSGWYVQSGWRVGIVLLLFLPIFAAYGLIARPDIWTAMAVTGLGMAALLVATVLLLPSLVTPLAALFRPFLLRRFGVAGRLAVDNLGRNRLRSALTAGALTIGLTTIIATSGLLTLFFEGSIGPIASMSHEDINIAPDFAKMMASGELSIENFYQSMATLPPLDPALVDALTSLARANAFIQSRLFSGNPGSTRPSIACS
jgi:putative ABC transport system permease protein